MGESGLEGSVIFYRFKKHGFWTDPNGFVSEFLRIVQGTIHYEFLQCFAVAGHSQDFIQIPFVVPVFPDFWLFHIIFDYKISFLDFWTRSETTSSQPDSSITLFQKSYSG